MSNSSWKDARPLLVAGALMLAAPAVPAAPEPVEPTADVPMAEGWRMETVVEGLEHPWSMAFLPDGDILVTERPGRLRLVRDGELVEDPIEGVPEVLAQNQGGLLDIVLHPDFEENRYVYLTYASGSPDRNRTTLARGVLEGDRLQDVEVLFQAEPDKEQAQHFGSRLAWLPDGTLLMSVGDGGNPPLEIDGTPAREHAQRLDSHLGKLLRLNDDGSVPEDNPFVGREDARPEIFSYGHRNIQGLAYDRDNDRIWVNEHGPLGGDELNLVQKGANHGWPLATYGADYRTGQRFTPHRTLEGGVAPKAVWTPAVAPSGLMVYTGDQFPDWRGDLFSGGLVGQDIRRIVFDGEAVQDQETLPIAQRVRYVTQGPDGYIYVLTDEEEGELLRLEPEQ
ncbi:PQQ-dependent sugar dehydrogenase [Ectothiorhodospiraceae bacterium 2226]|nr:PQQ-dependent sugar dehydrogenase [Ectothiorhodospiraceae bacterium 2226]